MLWHIDIPVLRVVEIEGTPESRFSNSHCNVGFGFTASDDPDLRLEVTLTLDPFHGL